MKNAVAIYAGKVISIPPIMRRIVELSERGYDLSNLLNNSSPEEVAKLSNLFSLHYGDNSELTKASKLGAFAHYADLPNGIKMSIEHALRKNHATFIVCTTTLAEGVNIPIKYLLLTTFSLGTSSVQIRKMQNMVGRTARAGIHTEGSAIITDHRFYDKRLDRRSGGNYKWAECKKMFDYDSTEACTSSILSLVSKLPIDYKKNLKARTLVTHFMNHYGEESCFSDLTTNICAAYKRALPDDSDRYDRYSKEIAGKVRQLELTVESIENYLCYKYNPEDNHTDFEATVEELTAHTFAYYLASEDQKTALKDLFKLIAKKVASNIRTDKAAYFAKSLYGIDTSNHVLEWVDMNLESLECLSFDEMLVSICHFFAELFPDKTGIGADELIEVARLWVSGETYITINNRLFEKPILNKIEKLCSNIISYHISFLIGNILDAIEDRSEVTTERLASLQKKVKYGVSSNFQIQLCENLFDDRVIVRQLDEGLHNPAVTDGALREYLASNQEYLFKTLADYPAYFSFRAISYLRRNLE